MRHPYNEIAYQVRSCRRTVRRTEKTQDLLGLCHNLYLGSFAMQVIEPQLLTRGTDVVYPASEADSHVLQLFTRLDDTLGTILLHVMRKRLGNVELVGVWVGVTSLTELLNLA